MAATKEREIEWIGRLERGIEAIHGLALGIASFCLTSWLALLVMISTQHEI